jgi:Mlc titration factor MtfA (ptsG expression regulator)
MFGFSKRRRRATLLATPLSEDAWATITACVPLLRDLPAGDRPELGGIANLLLAEKRFEGCGGLAVTDEMRLAIASQAALLLLHRSDVRTCRFYPGLSTILVYPAAYEAPISAEDDLGIVTEGFEERAGELSLDGAVVLSWDDIHHGAVDDERDGFNVVLHEFAHQLDGESGDLDGAPILSDPALRRRWAEVLGREYAELVARVDADEPVWFDEYGATDPSEFFAVATELFFEDSVGMLEEHPDLYRCLADYYLQDPAHWGEG